MDAEMQECRISNFVLVMTGFEFLNMVLINIYRRLIETCDLSLRESVHDSEIIYLINGYFKNIT